MKVIWRKRSGDDLDAALAYIAKESPSAAR
jgi:plasmid stabilization system protein ParE